ncbi:nucleotidyltransferase family protein [Marinomonas sp.]
MAAGTSSRFGSDKRFYILPNGATILETTIKNISLAHPNSDLSLVLSTTDHHKDFLPLLPINATLVTAAHAVNGLGASLSDLIAHRLEKDPSSEVTALGIYLADMPAIGPQTMSRLEQRANRAKVVRPTYKGLPGHPVWIGRDLWDLFKNLTADEGGKQALKGLGPLVELVEVNDSGVVMDLDTPDAVSLWQNKT